MDSSPSRVSELSFSSVWSLNVDKVCSDNTQHEQIVVSSEHSFAKVHSRTLSVGVCFLSLVVVAAAQIRRL